MVITRGDDCIHHSKMLNDNIKVLPDPSCNLNTYAEHDSFQGILRFAPQPPRRLTGGGRGRERGMILLITDLMHACIDC